MRRTRQFVYLSSAIAFATAGLGLGAPAAHAETIFHGIILGKECLSPTRVGDPYSCHYRIANSDDNDESITISNVTDVVHAAGGDQSAGNILGTLIWTAENGASCTAVQCILPTRGASITSSLQSFYTVEPGDFGLPNHALTDTVTVIWSEPVCVLGGCPIGDQESYPVTASTTVQLFAPLVTTALSPPGPGTLGQIVTDQATILGASANAGGSVAYAVYSDDVCTTLVQSLGVKTVTNGVVSASDPLIVSSGGVFWFQATYSGDAVNQGPVASPCASEPFVVIVEPGTIVTLLNPVGPVAAGTAVTDQATLIGLTANAGGVVHYGVYADDTCTTLVHDLGVEIVTDGSVGPSDPWSADPPGDYWFQATYSGDANNFGPLFSDCGTEPLHVQSTAATKNHGPGYWKNHQTATQSTLPLILGNHTVSTFSEAQTILSHLGCGSGGRLNCMAGMLLAAELNLANGGATCVQPAVADANTMLLKYAYHGFATYNLTPSDAAATQTLHNELSTYNIDGIPTC